jgi:hypothetical protein
MNICDIIGLITQDKKLTPIYPVIYLFFDMFEINDDGIDRDTIDKTLKKNIKFFIFEIIKQLIRIDLNKGQGDSTTAVKF